MFSTPMLCAHPGFFEIVLIFWKPSSSWYFSLHRTQLKNSLNFIELWSMDCILCFWLDALDILCVGLKLGTSFNRVWAESWEGQTNTHPPTEGHLNTMVLSERREGSERDGWGCNTGNFSSWLIRRSCQTVYVMVMCVRVRPQVGSYRGGYRKEEARAAFTGQTGNHQAQSAHYTCRYHCHTHTHTHTHTHRGKNIT